jgi:hypothetical protein
VASDADPRAHPRVAAVASATSGDAASGEPADSNDPARTPDADQPDGEDFAPEPTPLSSDQLPEDAPAPVAGD